MSFPEILQFFRENPALAVAILLIPMIILIVKEARRMDK